MIVRVYSHEIQCMDFPQPDQPHVLQAVSPVSEDMQDLALHHMIRGPVNPSAAAIREMDEQMLADPGSVGVEDLQIYHDLVTRAEMDALQRAEIILCTCVVSGDGRIQKGMNIREVCCPYQDGRYTSL